MALVTINGVPVLSGTIAAPLRGVWTADLVIDQPDGSGFEAGTAVSIEAADGVTLSGTVAPQRTGDFLDAVHVRVLGGAGGMGATVTARGYTQPSAYVRDVLNGLATDSGETLSSDISADLLGTNLVAWAVIAQPTSHALEALLAIVAPAASWRILADGTLWMGEESWPSSSPTYELENHDPAQVTYTIGVTSPSIMPGVDVEGIGKVARVEHIIEAERIQTKIWTDLTDDDRGPRASIAKIVRQEMAGIDYFALYDAKVVSQSADGATVDVQPGDERLPGMSKIPLRLGLPGTVAKFAPGQYVRLGWDRGNPQMPYACLFQGGETVTELDMDAAIVRLGDSGAVFTVKGPALLTWLSAHTHPVSGGTANASALATTGIQATKVKVT